MPVQHNVFNTRTFKMWTGHLRETFWEARMDPRDLHKSSEGPMNETYAIGVSMSTVVNYDQP